MYFSQILICIKLIKPLEPSTNEPNMSKAAKNINFTNLQIIQITVSPEMATNAISEYVVSRSLRFLLLLQKCCIMSLIILKTISEISSSRGVSQMISLLIYFSNKMLLTLLLSWLITGCCFTPVMLYAMLYEMSKYAGFSVCNGNVRNVVCRSRCMQGSWVH